MRDVPFSTHSWGISGVTNTTLYLIEYEVQELYGPQITEKDGVLLDEHDSFYLTTKSLLVLFQITGVMPIMRVPKGKLRVCMSIYSALHEVV